MNLFGKKKEQPKPTIPQPSAATNNAVDTIRTLRDHAETLEKRELHISKKVEAALAEAKQKAAKKDKKGTPVLLFISVNNPLFHRRTFRP